MTTWTRTGGGFISSINGRSYVVVKEGSSYALYCDLTRISDGYRLLFDAYAAAEAHAAAPAPAKQGVHIDNIAGQQLIDILKRSFTTSQIQDFMDASPFDEPDTGAPEGPLG